MPWFAWLQADDGLLPALTVGMHAMALTHATTTILSGSWIDCVQPSASLFWALLGGQDLDSAMAVSLVLLVQLLHVAGWASAPQMAVSQAGTAHFMTLHVANDKPKWTTYMQRCCQSQGLQAVHHALARMASNCLTASFWRSMAAGCSWLSFRTVVPSVQGDRRGLAR